MKINIQRISKTLVERKILKATNRLIEGTGFALISLFIFLSGLGIPQDVYAENVTSFTEAMTKGTLSFSFRTRYERVNQAGISKDAHAATLRTRLGYRTAAFKGFSGFLEFEDVSVLGNEQFNDTKNGKTQYPVVADPEDTEINQAYLQYSGWKNLSIKGGRQRIKLDNDRFIGNVGWRQNEQTFDALSLALRPLPEFVGTYVYLANVNRIFGAHHPTPARANTRMDAHLIHLAYGGLQKLKVATYAYLLDFENNPAASTQTFGIRFKGKRALSGKLKVLYTAEYAVQRDDADGAADNDADYFLGELGGSMQGLTAKVSYEVLGGDGIYGFSTPLATLHAFQGWADKFLSTPKTGIRDFSTTLSAKVAGVKLMAVYHDFSSDSNDFDYGTEIDFLAVKKISKNYLVGIKYARYEADKNAQNTGGTSIDTDKLWVTGQMTF